jgi:putative transposase
MYSSGVSRLRRPYLSDRFFFITVRLLERRRKLDDADFERMALSICRARAEHSFFLTAWVFLPNHWHAILAPQYPLTISDLMKSIKNSSTTLVNEGRGASGELWQERFFDRALRTVREYNEKVEYIHLNPVKAGLAARPQDWRWSSVNEYSGMTATEQMRRCGLTIDRVNLPTDPKARI